MDKQQRAEFIRRASFISEADRDMRAAFVDEIAQAGERKRVHLPELPEELYEHYVSMSAQTHEAAVKAYARAALAPSPGVDAAEQKPYAWRMAKQGGGYRFTQYKHIAEGWLPNGNPVEPLYAAPSPAASADEWMAEAERLLDAYVAARFAYIAVRDAVRPDKERAALLAHLKARPGGSNG